MPELQHLELSQLKESTTNPRQNFDKKRMAELIASVKESGIISPLLVRSTKNAHFEIVDGARRFRAAQEAKLATVPVIVRQLADGEALELQVIANDQRSDVHPLEQSAGYLRLQTETKFTLEQLATRLGKPTAYVAKRLQYSRLIEPIRKMFLANEIAIGHADLVARLQPEQQKETVQWLKRGDSVRGIKEEIERHFFLILSAAPFDTTLETLVVAAGSCVTCPKRTGFNKLLFDDVKQADVCTDPDCFESKIRAFIKIQVGTHPDAVLLSICASYDSHQKAKHLTTWVKAGNQNCPDTKEGVVVEQVSYHPPSEQAAKLGTVLKVCTNQKCKTHHPSQARSSSDYNSSTGGSKKAEKARKIELRRRGLVFKELAAEKFDVKEKDYRAILDWAIRGLNNDHARAICQAMEWEPIKGKYDNKDHTATIEKHLSKLDTDGVENWLYLIMLGDTDLWFYNNTRVEKPKLLEAKAQAAGVPLAELAKLSKEKRKKVVPAQPAAKSKK